MAFKDFANKHIPRYSCVQLDVPNLVKPGQPITYRYQISDNRDGSPCYSLGLWVFSRSLDGPEGGRLAYYKAAEQTVYGDHEYLLLTGKMEVCNEIR